MRICSFLPSATEIVHALGLQDQLYGVTFECDYPPEARTKPIVVRSIFGEAQLISSADISQMIGQRLKGLVSTILTKTCYEPGRQTCS